MFHDTIIIGGGASGLLAANILKDLNKDVAIIEKGDRIGKKILITGNGRCNISNKNLSLNRYHSNNEGFFNSIIKKYDFDFTKNYLSSIGIPLIELEDGKMYPMSLQASSVVDLFRLSLADKDIQVYTNTKIDDIKPYKNTFNLTTKDCEVFTCKNLIIATGGKSYEKTGSDGSGYTLAKKLGHSITALNPAIVQLKLNYPNLKALKGIKFDGSCEILVEGESMRKESGEILFTDYGISGPPILQISRIASIALNNKKKCALIVDLLPHLSELDLIDFLESRMALFANHSIHDLFICIINKKMIPIFLKDCGILNIHEPVYILDYKIKNELYSTLKCWKFDISGHNGFSNAQVTAGGIDTSYIDNVTLESKLVKNLYFCGEILDVDGDCGGFNLQWAFSSAIAAANGLYQNQMIKQ